MGKFSYEDCSNDTLNYTLIFVRKKKKTIYLIIFSVLKS